MDKVADTLGRVGAWCSQNKYLSSIKNAFQTFMPLTIAGAVGVLWTCVLVNESSGLGLLWSPIMALEFTNVAFNAISFATISCITVGITFGIAYEIGVWNLGADYAGYFPGILGLAAWISVTQTSFTGDLGDAFTGISSNALGASGLFTGMFIAILAVEFYCWLMKKDALKIKMPEMVPPGVARAFEALIPAFLVLLLTSTIGMVCQMATGLYLNDVIASLMSPLVAVGTSIPGVMVIYILIMLFWLVGIHGNNMLSAVKETLYTPLTLANTTAFENGETPEYLVNMGFLQMFGEFGGSGVTLGLVIAIFIFSKREDNRAVAGLSIVPGLFNINETVTFGVPMVLNPILGIPFVFTPCITIIIGYILSAIGFCPYVCISVPWTTPPVLLGFLATGGAWQGAVSQAIVIAVAVLVYTPFLLVYEKQQAKGVM